MRSLELGRKSILLEIDKILSSAYGEAQNTAKAYRDGKKVSAFGLCSYAKASLSALCASGKTLVVSADFYTARAFYDNIKSFRDDAFLLPSRDDALVYRDYAGGENTLRRLRALYQMATASSGVFICPAEALLQLYPDRERFLDCSLTVEKGKEYELEGLVKLLIEGGYRREPQISDIGRFSVRGDILDIWSVASEYPVRIEFFGDEVESIRVISAEDHRSGESVDAYSIAPLTEFFASTEERGEITGILSAEGKRGLSSPDFDARRASLISELISRVESGDNSPSLSFLLPLVKHCRLYEFGGFEGVIYDETKQVYDNIALHQTEHRNRFTALLSRGETLSFSEKQVEGEGVYDFSGKRLAFHSVTNANRIFAPDAVFNFRTVENPPYFRDFQALISDALNYDKKGYTVYMCAADDGLYSSLTATLRDQELPYEVGYGEGGLRILRERSEKGCVFHSERVAVIGTYDLKRKSEKIRVKRHKSEVFGIPEVGDFVVHEIHGIGRFEGVVKLDVSGARHDYLLITYASSDKLYVPIENMDGLAKFVSDGGGEPKLSRLGGADFARVKERVKKSVKELAINLVSLYGERLNGKGHIYSPDDGIVDEFGSSFEHSETDDQLTAIEEGLSDLKSGKIMDRLLCGDVGYGKTEVALRIAFKVIAEGKQVAFMAPTTILAKQHHETVVKRMEQFGVNIARLTRFDDGESRKKTLSGLKTGKIDIVVGTHRLLSKDVDFADLGLLILDEEQRFGVADKEKIKDLRRGVNVLTLSATPIPRTLHMSLVGIRDISVLDTPPVERIPVQTYVMEYGESLLVDACTREINRGGQVFIVYNRVSDIDRFSARVSELMPSARVIYAHGQMNEEKLEKRVEQFVSGEADILVSSTIVENGIDIARANTMIVMDADRLGLSQLYQLRGRVGRSNRLAYAFFTYDGRKTLTPTAYERLEAITQFTEFGSGFKIAMRDLEIRGAGSILGAQQHGHMEKVGYDMYCKLLSDAVGEIRGESVKRRGEVQAVVDYPVFIPEGYITDKEWRLRVYSRISRVSTLSERESLLADMKDIYGEVPESVKNLITVALIKNLAGSVGAEQVTLKRKEIALVFPSVNELNGDMIGRVNEHDGKVVATAKPAIKFPSGAKLLKFLLKSVQKRVKND